MSSELKKASVGLTFIGGILVFLVFGIFVLVWPRDKEQTLDEKRAIAREDRLNLLTKDNHAKLSVYAWVNKDKGIVQLPIDRAMQLVSAELATKQVQASSVKLENPYPYGLQSFTYAPAPAATGTAAPAKSGTAAPAASGPTAPAASGTTAPAPAASGTAAPK